MKTSTDLIFLAPPALTEDVRDEPQSAYEAYLAGATDVAVRR